MRWWRIERRLSNEGRFYLYMVFTIAVVAYIVVPWATQFFGGFGGYNPAYYEPRDFERQDYIGRSPDIGRSPFESVFFSQFYPNWWQVALKLLLLFLVGFLWFVTYSSSSFGGSGPRSRRR